MSCRAYLWYFWIGQKLKGALLWDIETCNFNAGGYAFFAVRITASSLLHGRRLHGGS